MGGEAHKIRDDAWLATPSPDGARVAFISPDYREVWLMKTNGEDPHKLTGVESGATFSQIAWSPDGNRLAYLKIYSMEVRREIETCDLNGANARLVWSDPHLQNFCWTSRGRIIATITAPDPLGGSHSDLWSLDIQKGSPSGQPRRVTNFGGFTSLSLSATADGRELALVRNYSQSDVYVGEWDAQAAHLATPRRLTLDDRIDWPGGWSRDSKTLFFYSDRQGSLDLFRQGLRDSSPELLLSSPDEKRQPQLSPDGSWVVFVAWKKAAGGVLHAGRVMRMPVSGGPPTAILDVKGYPGSAQAPRDFGAQVLTISGHPDLRCPQQPGAPCIVSETDARRIAFYAFDPVQGKKTTAASADIGSASFWDLSPDGAQIVLGEIEKSDRVRLLPVGGGPEREVRVSGFRQLASAGWAAHGAGLFVTGIYAEGGSILSHVSLEGRGQTLYRIEGWLERPMASPDGKLVAFGQATSNSNVWTVDNF